MVVDISGHRRLSRPECGVFTGICQGKRGRLPHRAISPKPADHFGIFNGIYTKSPGISPRPNLSPMHPGLIGCPAIARACWTIGTSVSQGLIDNEPGPVCLAWPPTLRRHRPVRPRYRRCGGKKIVQRGRVQVFRPLSTAATATSRI